MGPRYDDELLPTRVIYPKQRNVVYYIALLIAKCAKSFGLFLIYDLLKLVHVVPFLFIIKAGSAICLIILQRPSCRDLHRSHILRIIRHAIIDCFIKLLWLFSMSLCGPFRTTLLYEHSTLVVIAATGALFKGVGGPSKFRGAVFLVLAILGILLFDHDDLDRDGLETFHPEGQHDGILRHIFHHFLSWSGLSDHKGGVFLLVFCLLINAVFQTQSKKLSVDLGGAKRLQSLSTVISTLILLPWASFIHWSTDAVVLSLSAGILPFSVVILFVFVLDFYVESVASSKLEPGHIARVGSWTMCAAGLILSLLWNHPFVESLTTLMVYKESITDDHLLSGGVIFSLVLIYFATTILSSAVKPSAGRGSFVGYSSAGTPLYSLAEEALQKTTQSVVVVLRSGLKQILDDANSRKIFYFLLLNLSFTFVELVWGAWTNSLGLITDGFHMLFDCSALVVGLYAAVMSRWQATRVFSYGYDRVEILSGFANGLFLVVVAFFIILAAISRLLDPPQINTDKLLTVSTIGLCVNLFGMFAFSHAHSHGGASHGHSHGGGASCPSHGAGSHSRHGSSPSSNAPHSCSSHGGGHGHSHEGASHGHSHNQSHHSGEESNSNMRGVFLHVLADTLGSVGVIFSTLLIQNFGWNIADPLCSLFIGILVFISVIPLLSDTAHVLLLRLPADMSVSISQALRTILSFDGVLSYRDQHFWRHSSSTVCGTIHIQVDPHASEQVVVSQVTAVLKNAGIKTLTVQVEKEDYFMHMAGLSGSTSVEAALASSSRPVLSDVRAV